MGLFVVASSVPGWDLGSVYNLAYYVGGGLLALSVVLSFFGIDFDSDSGDIGAGEGLHLFSVRTITAFAACFGAGGRTLSGMGVDTGWSFAGAVLIGAVAAVLVAMLTRLMDGLEQDRTPQLEQAVGTTAKVYLPVPAAGAEGFGMVSASVGGRTLEVRAVSTAEPAATGSIVKIERLVGADMVEVTPVTTPR